MSQEKKLYIAYGSNLNIEGMSHRCPGAVISGTAILKNYELLFRSHANVEPKEGSSVPVAVWEIQPQNENSLDWYEGYPSYYGKETVEVELDGRPVSAMVYTMKPGRQPALPHKGYLSIIKEGYEAFGFDMAVLDKALERTRELIREMEQAGPEGGGFPSMKL